MAFKEQEITDDAWTLILSGVSEATFQNVGQFPMYVNFNSSNTEPTETVGIAYPTWDKEVTEPLTNLTNITSPSHVFVRAVSRKTTVIYEE